MKHQKNIFLLQFTLVAGIFVFSLLSIQSAKGAYPLPCSPSTSPYWPYCPYSAGGGIGTLPATKAPTLNSVTATSTGFYTIPQTQITWTDNEPPGMFTVFRSTDGGKTYNPLATTTKTVYVDPAMPSCSAPIYYGVNSIVTGKSVSAMSNIGTLDCTLPVRPTITAVTPVSTSQINVSWTDNSTNEDHFNIYRDGLLVSQVPAISGTGTASTYYSGGLNCSTTYTYVVAACNANGCANSN